MTAALPFRIFLATPGDLTDERAAVRSCVDEYNRRYGRDGGVTYEIVEWDQTRGTARRAQEAINELIAESHFMIAMFKRTWGSTPGSPWGYTSGTEEELFTGLLELGQSEQPMRDVWVAFVYDSNPDARITSLRRQIIDRHALMFEGVTDLRDLKTRVSGLLRTWEGRATKKTPRLVELVPSSGKEVLRAANLRLRGEQLIRLGQADAGRALLRESSILGGPVEYLAYARALRHAHELEGAYAETQRAIDYFATEGNLFSDLAADAFSAQARVLSAQGREGDAIGRLEHALTLLVGDDAFARGIRCRVHDDLGLAYRTLKDDAAARRNFEAALTIRREQGPTIDVGQSLVNLARLEVAAEHLDLAVQYAEEAIVLLHDSPPSGLHANAEVLLAQVRLRQGRPEEGISHAQRALAVNRQIGNAMGEAIALYVIAQCARAAGQQAEADEYARACLAQNESIGNLSGAQKAQWLLDNPPT